MTIRIDEDLKRDFDSVCKDLGISMNSAVVIFAKKMVREKRIPFEVSVGFSSNENTRGNSVN
jgi:DNA-damage-inducible protein J